MASRVALPVVLPSICSAISFVHTASLRDRGYVQTDANFLAAIDANAEQELRPAVEVDCQEAAEGSACHSAVAWLRKEGLATHPEWYPGYSSTSTFEEVQDMLHGLGKAQCPRPCFAKVPAALIQTSARFDCHDAVEGDWCYHSITWLREKGLQRHPDWYPTLQTNSNNSWIQAELHRKGKSDCPWPCGLTREDAAEEDQTIPTESIESILEPEHSADQTTQGEQPEEDCRTAQPETRCYTAVTFALAGGIKAHPDVFKGLAEDADFKRVQEYFYLQSRHGCERPCSEKRIDPSKFFQAASHADTLREKKRLEDMSTEELSMYLDGKWDGYVKKEYKVSFSGEATSTFQKRSSLDEQQFPTTTPFGAEEKEALPLINPEAAAMTSAEADSYMEEALARRLLEEKTREEKRKREEEEAAAAAAAAAAWAAAREKKSVEDMSSEEMEGYLNGTGSVQPALPALGVVSAERATASGGEGVEAQSLQEAANVAAAEEAANASAAEEAANASASEEAANASASEEAANGTEELEALPALALESASTVEVSEEAGVGDDPMPLVDAEGSLVTGAEESEAEADRRMELEQQPEAEPRAAAGEEEREAEAEQQPRAETPEEMERRIRADLMEKNEKALKVSEEEMWARIRAEVMADLANDKGQ
ncbi:unnamed protein product [Prorocentrum cordatum]|uniref:Thiol oxidase n=1 Tax=Prorocentrum cordatum TaxID=2364126 RepID=A0ABN9SUI3_9DINO|nr:unnamed protein product [Polarella glacialis]